MKKVIDYILVSVLVVTTALLSAQSCGPGGLGVPKAPPIIEWRSPVPFETIFTVTGSPQTANVFIVPVCNTMNGQVTSALGAVYTVSRPWISNNYFYYDAPIFYYADSRGFYDVFWRAQNLYGIDYKTLTFEVDLVDQSAHNGGQAESYYIPASVDGYSFDEEQAKSQGATYFEGFVDDLELADYEWLFMLSGETELGDPPLSPPDMENALSRIIHANAKGFMSATP